MTIEQFTIDGTVVDVTPPPPPAPIFQSATPAGRLREAAVYVREHWTRRQFSDGKGNVCAVGAIVGMREGQPNTAPRPLLEADRLADMAVEALAEYLSANGGDYSDPHHFRVGIVSTWNDSYAIDAEDVASTMEKAAARWEEQHG